MALMDVFDVVLTSFCNVLCIIQRSKNVALKLKCQLLKKNVSLDRECFFVCFLHSTDLISHCFSLKMC